MSVYNEYFANYTKLTQGGSIIESLEHSEANCLAVLSSISEEKGLTYYAEGKWTVNEVIAHMNDTERIMAYRALRFARNDASELRGFDENDYARFSNANNRTTGGLVSEFEELRISTLGLFNSFNEKMLDRKGTANSLTFDVAGLGLIIAGHSLHHCQIFKERYGID